MNENTCVCCGNPIPEGSQVCYKCQNNANKKEYLNEKADSEE